jgi:aspartate racemase
MLTIGVLGGMGPQATTDFEARIHAASQRLIPAFANTGYPPMVVVYHRRPPFLLNEDRTPMLPLRLDPALLEAAAWLGARADFIVIAANAPHLFAPQVEDAAGRSLLSMIDVTIAEVARRGWDPVGVLGFGDPRVPVYSEPLARHSIEAATIDARLQSGLDDAVLRTHEGRNTADSARAVRDAVDALRARCVPDIILGCTELPLLLGPDAGAPDLLNPATLLAEAAVRRAIG